MWKKRLGVQWNTKDRKPPAIGKPSLIDTTVDETLLHSLPTTQQAQSRAYRIHPEPAAISPFMKELPPLDLCVSPVEVEGIQLTLTSQMSHEQPHEPYRPVSYMPSSSSIYTRSTPEMRHDFDPSSQVAPLFSERKGYYPDSDNHNSSVQSWLPSIDSSSTLRPSFTDRARQAGADGLGVTTNARQPWQGASGETTLMTPIAATPAETESQRSISLPDENMSDGRSSYDGAQHYPSPDSQKNGIARGTNLQPAVEFRTPTQDDWEDGVSIGYDVSPWSTPSSRPYYGSIIDDSTPARTVSYRRRRSISASPSYRRPTGAKNRFSTDTRTSDGNRTVFEVSEPPNSVRPAFDMWANSNGAHVKRNNHLIGNTQPVTPPMQTGFRKPSQAQEQPNGPLHNGAHNYTQLQVGNHDGPIPKLQTSRRAPQSQETPPRVSHFSWTTLGTETTYPNHDGTPDRNAATPSTKFFESPDPSPAPLPARQTIISTPRTIFETTPQATPIMHTPEVIETPPSPIMTRRRPISTSPHLDAAREHPALARTPHHATPFIKRKPTPSLLSVLPTSSSSEKALPTTPVELSTHDYITTLTAQLQSLSHRKHNLLKMVQGLESVTFGQANPMVVDLEERRLTKGRMRAVQEELAEVRREEHEIGLRLMKAEKRRDQEGPTALWIRRVTE